MLKRLKNADLPLVFVIMLLCGFGLLMVYSASDVIGSQRYGDPSYFFHKQSTSLLIGLCLFLFSACLPYKRYARLVPLFVVGSLVLLLLVLIPGIGLERNFSRRWLGAGPVVVQPSELAKIAMILYFASIYTKKQPYIHQFVKGVLPPLVILGTAFLLTLAEPDLGTASLILAACGSILLCAGLKKRHLFVLGATAVSGVVYLAFSASYRVKRLVSFTNPFGDTNGDGYQLIQSYFAISGGGFFGRGLGNSVEKMNYLPEAHTDFIMAVISEELGIFGVLIVLGLYFALMLLGVKTAVRADDPFGKLLAIGITFQLMFQVVLNLGAMSGLLPVTGVPLPFISYGGSSLIMTLFLCGILVNISTYAKKQPVRHKRPVPHEKKVSSF
ncbi:putative lipid II flippase FtsW [Bacillus velezensis]|uniref:putative lipid II flippase FtsW n=1 Tax=Bacillus velezensis TaxID=492670 RepID=UPI00100C313B|nr:putative lipid II flippase FtsW [Bacillus velezensis]MEC3795826.1 putative lipid II flippase FtsW [Bacillus velezensis]RXK30425.1 putative lipid II flippase FtsW [Bacillus velezensis]